MAMKFGNATDRELIINTARGMGWSPLQSVDIHEDSFVDSDLHENVCLNAVINIDKFWISRGILENFRDGDLGDLREFKIYCRYKFYDHGKLVIFEISLELKGIKVYTSLHDDSCAAIAPPHETAPL